MSDRTPHCGARTRRGTICRAWPIKRTGKCKYHGGMSTGAKTPEGIERIRRAQIKRHAENRAKNPRILPAVTPRHERRVKKAYRQQVALQQETREWLLGKRGIDPKIERLAEQARRYIEKCNGKQLKPRVQLILSMHKAFLADIEKQRPTQEEPAKEDKTVTAEWICAQIAKIQAHATAPVAAPDLNLNQGKSSLPQVPEKHIPRLAYAEQQEANQQHARAIQSRYGSDEPERPTSYMHRQRSWGSR